MDKHRHLAECLQHLSMPVLPREDPIPAPRGAQDDLDYLRQEIWVKKPSARPTWVMNREIEGKSCHCLKTNFPSPRVRKLQQVQSEHTVACFLICLVDYNTAYWDGLGLTCCPRVQMLVAWSPVQKCGWEVLRSLSTTLRRG